MKSFLFTILFSVIATYSFSQNAIAKIKYEQAEEAYQNGKYQDAIDYLNEAEKILKGPNTTTLYLKIVSQNKLVESNKEVDFNLINSLRQNCDSYLKSAEGSVDLEDKFKEVYFISESLKKYPKTQAEYDLILKKKQDEQAEKDRVANEQREINRKAQEEQNRINQAEQQLLKEKEFRDISYVAFKIGYNFMLNSNSKQTISYNQWYSASENSPLTTAIKSGKLGVSYAFTMGINGVKCLDKVSQKFKNKKMALGLMYDFSQTFVFYNFNDVTGYPDVYSWYFEDDKNLPFSISNLGLGTVLSFRIGEKKSYFDAFFRADLNIFSMGKYSSSYGNSSGYGDVTTYRDGIKVGMSPTIGFNYRFNKTYFGVEFRLKVIDKSTFVEESSNYDYYTYTSSSNLFRFTPINGVNLSYLSLNFGFLF